MLSPVLGSIGRRRVRWDVRSVEHGSARVVHDRIDIAVDLKKAKGVFCAQGTSEAGAAPATLTTPAMRFPTSQARRCAMKPPFE